jgi:heterodisulfide reductase subunit C
MDDLSFLTSRPSRQIDFDEFDHHLLDDVLKHEPTFLTCISCGGCTATCSAGSLIDFNVRKIGLLLRRGNTAELSVEIEKCMFCGKCSLICPRDINIRNVILLVKKNIVALNPDI